MNSIINFGQTPYQIFKEKHPKRELKGKNKKEMKEINEQKESEYTLGSLRIQDLYYKMRNPNNYIYFEINPILNKIFSISIERYMEIIDTDLYKKNGAHTYSLTFHDFIQLPYFLFNDKINIGIYDYFIYKIKYAFCSFDILEENINNKNIENKGDIFKTFGREIIENIEERLKNKDKNIVRKNENNEEIYYKFLSCRYIDKTFKIHRFSKNNKNKDKDFYKPISFICEDFVSSCCTISYNIFYM